MMAPHFATSMPLMSTRATGHSSGLDPGATRRMSQRSQTYKALRMNALRSTSFHRPRRSPIRQAVRRCNTAIGFVRGRLRKRTGGIHPDCGKRAAGRRAAGTVASKKSAEFAHFSPSTRRGHEQTRPCGVSVDLSTICRNFVARQESALIGLPGRSVVTIPTE